MRAGPICVMLSGRHQTSTVNVPEAGAREVVPAKNKQPLIEGGHVVARVGGMNTISAARPRFQVIARRLGIAAACVGLLLALQAASFAVGSAAAGHAPPTRNPLQFLSGSLATVTMFSLFLTSALVLRRRREWHKRFMLFASLTLLVPAMGRLDTQIMQPLGLPRALLPLIVTIAFLVWAAVNDWRQSRRVHPAYIIGGIAYLVSFPLRGWVGRTDAWLG
jgi:hypothetical protein